jgi:glutamate synthase (NADPH/NADH) large chain
VTDDDFVVMASEVGVIDIDPAKVVSKGRLQPGKMFVVDLEQGRIISDDELKKDICTRQPYGKWVKENKVRLIDLPEPGGSFHKYDPITFLKRQISFGYTSEDLRMILAQMCETGKEALGSMGNDTPLAVLSRQAQHLSSYFKQLFAQVTNPPIDPIRERLVMSLASHVGHSTYWKNLPSIASRWNCQLPSYPTMNWKKFDTSITAICKPKRFTPTSKPMENPDHWKKD